uniref:Uncharacterized protein n=1 Tax=Anopheles maculatus TaxID=74869 RepID=A0A182STH6_9DIPT
MAQNDPLGVYLELLQEKYTEFKKRPRRYPDMETLKLVLVLFSTSKRKNSVVPPALIFIGEILTRCQVRDRRHISRGLLLVTNFLKYDEHCKCILPSAVAFLSGVLEQACPEGTLTQTTAIKKPFALTSSLLLQSGLNDTVDSRIKFQLTAKDLLSPELTTSFKMRAIACTVSFVGVLYTQLQHLETVPIYAKHFLHSLQIMHNS